MGKDEAGRRKGRSARWTLLPFLLLAGLGLGLASPNPARATTLLAVQARQAQSAVLLDFLLSAPAPWHLSHAHGQLRITLPQVHLALPVRPLFGAEPAPLSTLRTIESTTGCEIELAVSGECAYAAGLRGNHLLVALAPAHAAIDLAAALRHLRLGPAASPERAATLPFTPLLNQPAGASLVVIDPGHGGFDPGTRAANGLLEKDLALTLSRKLAVALKQRGVRTLLTRDDDRYLSLPARTAIADRAGADLFVSIHLNWSPNPNAAGLQVYYLNNTTDRATLRLARMENRGQDTVPANGGLDYILSDLRQEYKATQSSALATGMEAAAVDRLRAQFGPEIHGLGAHRGSFYVLVGAAMPAVLVEGGFLSNSRETAHLMDPTYQQALVDGLAQTIVQYLNQNQSAGAL